MFRPLDDAPHVLLEILERATVDFQLVAEALDIGLAPLQFLDAPAEHPQRTFDGFDVLLRSLDGGQPVIEGVEPRAEDGHGRRCIVFFPRELVEGCREVCEVVGAFHGFREQRIDVHALLAEPGEQLLELLAFFLRPQHHPPPPAKEIAQGHRHLTIYANTADRTIESTSAAAYVLAPGERFLLSIVSGADIAFTREDQ